MVASSHIVLLAIAAVSRALLQTDQPLLPNGTCYLSWDLVATGYFPCTPNESVAACCEPGWSCFSGGQCITTTRSRSFPNLTLGLVQRTACTNPKWLNAVCGDKCLDDLDPNSHLVACGDDRFCCGKEYNEGKCNCESQGGAFTQPLGSFQTIINVSDLTFTGTPSLSVITPSTKSHALTSTSGLPKPVLPASNTSTSSGGSAGEATSQTRRRTNRALVIGLAAGIGGGILAIVASLCVWWHRKQRKRAARSQHLEMSKSFPSSGGSGTATADADPSAAVADVGHSIALIDVGPSTSVIGANAIRRGEYGGDSDHVDDHNWGNRDGVSDSGGSGDGEYHDEVSSPSPSPSPSPSLGASAGIGTGVRVDAADLDVDSGEDFVNLPILGNDKRPR